ncbi:MAG: YbaB/EbfC family nucleoid-associated protein [Kiritimatiellia bacterium]|jgi:DNA-binding YbaB/EbfC family protein
MAAPNFFQQAKQAMEIRSQVKKMQKQLEARTVEFENAGVKVTANGDLTITAISINPEVVDITRLDKLERTIMENANRALKKAKDDASAEMQKMTKEMGLDKLLGG